MTLFKQARRLLSRAIEGSNASPASHWTELASKLRLANLRAQATERDAFRLHFTDGSCTDRMAVGLLFEYLGYSNKCSIFGILRRIPNTDIRKLANEYHYSIFDISFVIFEYLGTLVFGASKVYHRPHSVAVRVSDL